MRVPAKYLFYDGLPNAKDIDKIMAQGGYHSLPSPDTSNYQPVGDITDHIPGPGWGTGPNVNPTNASRNYPGLAQGKGIDIDSVQASVGMPGDPMNLGVTARRPNMDNNPNGLGQYFNTALGLADSAIPSERIHKNYVTQPLPVYNPYQYGTGSQAIMEDGGYVNPGDDYNYSAKSGWLSHAVNPAHKGWCTPLSNPHCTGHRRAFALRAKHHNLEEGGILEMPNGGITRGLIPQPTYNFTPGTNPNASDSSMYLSNYNNLVAGNAGAMKMYNQLNMYGVPSTVSPDARTLALNQFNAYNDAAGKNIMTDQQVHNELYKPFAKPKDISSRKKAHGENGIMLYPYDIEMADDGIMLQPYDMDTAANGSHLTADKAKEMLRDGTAQGHALTKKQKKYFGYIAGGGIPKAPNGATVGDPKKNVLQQSAIGENSFGNLQSAASRNPTNLLDNVNYTLTHGGARPQGLQQMNPQDTQLMTDAYIYSQRQDMRGKSPQDIIGSYFGRPVDPNNPLSVSRGRLNQLNHGAVSDYNMTPNMSVRDPNAVQQALPSMASGGFVPGSVHDLSEEQIARLLKSGHRIEYL